MTFRPDGSSLPGRNLIAMLLVASTIASRILVSISVFGISMLSTARDRAKFQVCVAKFSNPRNLPCSVLTLLNRATNLFGF